MSESALQILIEAGVGFVLLMSAAWLASMRMKFLSLVDAVWAMGIPVGVILLSLRYGQNSSRSILAVTLASLWGLRLGVHLSVRLARHFPIEDTRYQALRLHWKDGLAWKSYLFFIFKHSLRLFLFFLLWS